MKSRLGVRFYIVWKEVNIKVLLGTKKSFTYQFWWLGTHPKVKWVKCFLIHSCFCRMQGMQLKVKSTQSSTRKLMSSSSWLTTSGAWLSRTAGPVATSWTSSTSCAAPSKSSRTFRWDLLNQTLSIRSCPGCCAHLHLLNFQCLFPSGLRRNWFCSVCGGPVSDVVIAWVDRCPLCVTVQLSLYTKCHQQSQSLLTNGCKKVKDHCF